VNTLHVSEEVTESSGHPNIVAPQTSKHCIYCPLLKLEHANSFTSVIALVKKHILKHVINYL